MPPRSRHRPCGLRLLAQSLWLGTNVLGDVATIWTSQVKYTRTEPGMIHDIFFGSFVGYMHFPVPYQKKWTQQICISPKPGSGAILTYTRVLKLILAHFRRVVSCPLPPRPRHWDCVYCYSMVTWSNGNIFCVTGHLCGELTGPRWIPRTKTSDAELSCFLWYAPE